MSSGWIGLLAIVGLALAALPAGLTIANQFDADHQSLPANVADQWMTLRQREQ